MSLHKDVAIQKFDDFKKQFGHSLNLVGDSVDTFQLLIKKHGFNIEEKLHAKALTRVKKEVLILLIRYYNTFKEDLRMYLPKGVEEFEKRVNNSLEKTDKDLDDLDKY